LTSRTKLIAGAAAVAVLAAGGAAFAAVELTSSSHSTPEPAVTAPFGDGVGSYGLGGGRLGGRGLGGGLGPVGERDDLGPGSFGLRAGFVGGGLGVAATYLGLSASELRTQLASGQSFAQIAKAQGKTADGLVAAMVAAQKKLLDAAVSNGVLTQAQATALESRLAGRIKDLVNGVHRFHGPGAPGGSGSFSSSANA
jgi:ribosomal protein S20